MWVKLKDNFQSNRELSWLFLGEILAKNLFPYFSKVCISDFICLEFFFFFSFLLLPFLKTTCMWLSVLLGTWCHFTWLQREIQHPRLEPWKISNCLWTPDCLLLGEEACWFRNGDAGTTLKFTDPSHSNQLHPKAYGNGGEHRAEAFELVPGYLGELLALRPGGWLQTCKHPASAVVSWHLESGPCVQQGTRGSDAYTSSRMHPTAAETLS